MAYNVWNTITPSDTVDFSRPPDAIWVGGAGTVAVVSQSGVVSTLTAVAAGTTLPMVVRRINSTGTTATALVALYAV